MSLNILLAIVIGTIVLIGTYRSGYQTGYKDGVIGERFGGYDPD